MKQPRLIMVLIALGLFMLFLGVYYWRHQDDGSRDSQLIGEKICGNLASGEAQASCCAQLYPDFVETCSLSGAWTFNASVQKCVYVCEPEQVFCTAEALLCPDNRTYVARNSSKQCAFDACPL